jgi:hypothetical protein
MDSATATYKDDILNRANQDPAMACLAAMLSKPERSQPRFIHFSEPTHPCWVEDRYYLHASSLVAKIQQGIGATLPQICIIEDITPSYVLELGTQLNLPAEFFARHVSNPTPENLWTIRGGTTPSPPIYDQHLIGIYEYQDDTTITPDMIARERKGYADRIATKGSDWPLSFNTSLSFCQIRRNTRMLHALRPCLLYS